MQTNSGRRHGLLRGARVYLSGPMDFVASRQAEKQHGWRNRIAEFLRFYGATVFDPWNKPEVRGLHEYGREDAQSVAGLRTWSFANNPQGRKARALCERQFRETLHVDLRMVDTTDFTIAFCPTNVYSVGTVHEIALCRQQRKPVLLVSPAVEFPALAQLRDHLRKDRKATRLLKELERQVPIKPNPLGTPSLWYMALVGGEGFFDGFGFGSYRKTFDWQRTRLDEQEEDRKLYRPLLPFLEKLTVRLPRKWDPKLKKLVPDDDWLLWDVKPKTTGPRKA